MWQLKTERPQRDTEYLDRGEEAQRGDQQIGRRATLLLGRLPDGGEWWAHAPRIRQVVEADHRKLLGQLNPPRTGRVHRADRDDVAHRHDRRWRALRFPDLLEGRLPA